MHNCEGVNLWHCSKLNTLHEQLKGLLLIRRSIMGLLQPANEKCFEESQAPVIGRPESALAMDPDLDSWPHGVVGMWSGVARL